MNPERLKTEFDAAFARYHRRERVHPDPLEFLYRYETVRDREIAGLVASSLAYGRVAQILAGVGRVLDALGPSPFEWVMRVPPAERGRALRGFRHRWTTGAHLDALLSGARAAIERHGSLGACFASRWRPRDETVLPAAMAFAEEVGAYLDEGARHLLPSPRHGSACKRLNLYLRWMVRCDEVDPGGWEAAATPGLIVPLDTHLWRVATARGMTRRRQPDLRAALEITAAFRRIAPDDPVRYDFALTRPGIGINNTL